LRQHLDGDVVGDALFLDDLPDEVEIGLRRRGKTDLDLLESQSDQEIEEASLALGPHRFDERLIAVAEIDAAPDGCALLRAGRPLAVRQLDGGVRPVFVNGHADHD